MIFGMATAPSNQLETFPNPRPGRDFEIAMECPEFPCVCPRTGQPNSATIRIRYVPAELCLELKSLKLYLWSYRNEGRFTKRSSMEFWTTLCKPATPRQ